MKTFFLLAFLALSSSLFAQDQIVGTYWSPKKDGKIEIYKKGNKYFGKIKEGKNPQRKDFKNPDASLRERLVVGLEFLTDFVFNGDNSWTDGKIYDPESGKTYSCNMSLDDKNNLKVRGYIGVSLLGRTEVFERIVNK